MQDKNPLPKHIYQYTEPELQRFRELCNFTERELEVFELKAKGHTNFSIARDANMSESTVSNYIRRIKKKMLTVVEKL